MHLKTLSAICSALSISAFASLASAATFDYAYSSNDGLEGASGTLFATSNGDGTFTATGGTISAFGPVIGGSGSLIANPSAPAVSESPSGFFNYDDQLLPGQDPLITPAGLLFEIGGDEIDIFSNGPGPGTYQFFTEPTVLGEYGNFALSEVSAAPEPSTWALMIAGVGLTGAALRFGRRSGAPATT